jgi:hypothetical protein
LGKKKRNRSRSRNRGHSTNVVEIGFQPEPKKKKKKKIKFVRHASRDDVAYVRDLVFGGMYYCTGDDNESASD